jgi:glycosyltransferase involved in cell wall biosynthesis
MPRISVIIPTFNRRRMLERAMSSVLAQTFTDRELIVVDDGSTDGTADLPVFNSGRPDIRYLRFDENRGVSFARNRGVERTSTPLIAFLDSDDEWLPRKLEKQVCWLADHPGFRIVQTREYWVRDGRRVNPPATHEKIGGDIFAESLKRCMITPSSVVLERSLFIACGGFNETFTACEDYDLWLRITCRYPVGLLDEYLLTRYGGHEDQLSSTVPVLDGFRIRSMMDLLLSGALSEDQAARTRAMIASKARVIAQGCKKRGNEDDYERYQRIADCYQ